MLADIARRDLELLLNAAGAILNGRGRRVVVDTIGTGGGLAVVSAERGAIDPSHGRRGNAGTEWDLWVRVQSAMSLE